jgi:hypothetical protein
MPDGAAHQQAASDKQGRYSNFFKIGYNAYEFLLDFGQSFGDEHADILHTRIITSPTYAKALSELLLESLQQYEQAHGPILSGEEL